ncbi:homocysteine S-methyltransferase [Dyella sp. M7H15-1]|uniref:homocysteine S-methyltransferase family protein n=1 Tax=Dyella sp. M7H15-1 TaxID=2501295 RepID=UPI001004EC2E|nr:homocysteine S-methyltransferase family protein [Dyella sp. M7H15-1]QAU23891.1 homocysteine S-methyltransferase [Dyella sp. M7H15-1]
MHGSHNHLPQLNGRLFMTDGGLGTTLIFHEHRNLPHFASFMLLGDARGRQALWRYYASYAELAQNYDTGLVLDSPTWRANRDWGAALGYDTDALKEANHKAITLLLHLRELYETERNPMVIGGNVGPRGDGYTACDSEGIRIAADYHRPQIETLIDAGVDMISALTMTHSQEATGIALAAWACAAPVVVSYTVETNGRLPSGETLPDAIARTDDCTSGYPAYYMINCAHPQHFAPMLEQCDKCRGRIRGLRANASCRSHAELDACQELDAGNPEALGEAHRSLMGLLPNIAVVGGCCGTDTRHVEAIFRHCAETQAPQQARAAASYRSPAAKA